MSWRTVATYAALIPTEQNEKGVAGTLPLPPATAALGFEDSGAAAIATFYADPSTMFVRLQSYDEERVHPEFAPLQGRRVRITVEVEE